MVKCFTASKMSATCQIWSSNPNVGPNLPPVNAPRIYSLYGFSLVSFEPRRTPPWFGYLALHSVLYVPTPALRRLSPLL